MRPAEFCFVEPVSVCEQRPAPALGLESAEDTSRPELSTDGLAIAFIPATGSEEELVSATYLAALADPSPRARLISEIALHRLGAIHVPIDVQLVSSAQSASICGVDLAGQMVRKGSINAIEDWLSVVGGYFHNSVRRIVGQVMGRGGLAIVVANQDGALGVVCLEWTGDGL